MITRILIDNYRCFEKATLEPGSLTLLLGPNGAGKSAVFEVLFKLRQVVVDGSPVSPLFPDSTRTRWLDRGTQTFELGLQGPDGLYTYRLSIRHKGAEGGFIEREEIRHENRVRYSFSGEEVKVWPGTGGVAYTFPAGAKVSPLSNLPRQYKSKQLAWVTERLARIWVFRPVPQTLEAVARVGEGGFLAKDLSNFASWLEAMQVVRTTSTFSRNLKRSLRIVLEGFRDYDFEPQGRGSHLLQFSFASPRRGRVSFAFNELSEGQRALVVLYALLHAVSGEVSTLCIDEPENFLSPREIQPWLNRLMDETEAGGQALLISHNPGLIDFLAPTEGLLIEREGGGPARVRPVPTNGTGLPVSELLARGWLDE